MARPPRARESVLDAFERLLVDEGERAATMDAAARAAGVSKGGLLYHFASKDALEAALIERLTVLVDEDVAAMASAPEGPVAFFVRTSVMDDDPLDRALIATSRLAQAGHADAAAALRDVRTRWEEALRPHVRDAAALDLVLLVSDGLYYNNALSGTAVAGPVPQGTGLDELIALVEAAVR
ncbi:MAG: transcriptional regulator [Microbacterium sp. SCN 70-27]|uniref:TetR/AcrR family transcriptional regulator n=1 Tax=unclassified Microbacterium TaxID=2609290 RepID=UPI00086AE75E|nr:MULTISPECIES: TetR/AcrR family transcriptional regulator [unclassified Microbacterium]MBN9223538.1 TetR/AcrR family transcriptional regulator [Microbacterium sp.]ODT28595.1 MAG: transcriptional regulator [Microbacterium sp. SCN 70-27]